MVFGEMLFNFFTRLFRKMTDVKGFPRYIDNVWYNITVYAPDLKYPIIFDNCKNYIHANYGNEVVMGVTDNNKKVYYKIRNIRWQTGSDWTYPSDAIHVDLVFSRIEK